MPTKGTYYRQPRSRCIAYTSWSAIAKTVQTGKRKVAPGSKGIVDVAFARNPARYYYILSTPLRYDFWQRFINSSSKGRFWNNYMLGRF